MKASDCTFEQMQTACCSNKQLAMATSYMQVEYGLDELRAGWDGFVDTSDHCGLAFKSRKHIITEFTDALIEYLEYLGEPLSVTLG